MKLKNEIESLQDELNKISSENESLCKNKIVELSQRLDKLITKYYLKYYLKTVKNKGEKDL